MYNSDDKVYLRSDVQVEPLINNWYAWVHLVPPVTSAFNFVNRYQAIMSSYITAPEMHATAVKNPAMRGGPFIDIDSKHINDVTHLLEQLKQENANNKILVNAIKKLNDILLEKAKGYSLASLYEEVPHELKGYVELFYDLNHIPGFRFFESLLYKTQFYNTGTQSIALSIISSDADRSFILSTPRFENDDTLMIKTPFVNQGLDELFKMKRVAQPMAYIEKILGAQINNRALFHSFFTTRLPKSYQKYSGNSFRIRYFGHACILLESPDISILIDPVLSYTYDSEISRFTYDDLPDEIDYVLITHAHQDHILLETMLQLRSKVKNIVIGRNADGMLQDPSLELLLTNLGFGNVIELRDLQSINFKGGSITAIPFMGEHHDIAIQSKICFHIMIGSRSLLSMADSCNIEPKLYENIHRITGDVDALFLGMECDGAPASWVYGPLFLKTLANDKSNDRRGRGCNYDEAIDIVKRFNCKEVYIYAMGLEPWLKYILGLEYTTLSNPIVESNRLLEKCKQEGISAERLFGEREILMH